MSSYLLPIYPWELITSSSFPHTDPEKCHEIKQRQKIQASPEIEYVYVVPGYTKEVMLPYSAEIDNLETIQLKRDIIHHRIRAESRMPVIQTKFIAELQHQLDILDYAEKQITEYDPVLLNLPQDIGLIQKQREEALKKKKCPDFYTLLAASPSLLLQQKSNTTGSTIKPQGIKV